MEEREKTNIFAFEIHFKKMHVFTSSENLLYPCMGITFPNTYLQA